MSDSTHTPGLNVAQEIATGEVLITGLVGVKEYALIGSAMYLPPEQVNDVDFCILLNEGLDSCSFTSDLIGQDWGRCGDYDGVGGIWFAVRRDNLNFMVTHDAKFYANYRLSMEVCKALRLQSKEERIAVCKVIRDGLDADSARVQAGVYWTPKNLQAICFERDALRAEVERLRGALTGVLSSNPEGLSSNPRSALKGGA